MTTVTASLEPTVLPLPVAAPPAPRRRRRWRRIGAVTIAVLLAGGALGAWRASAAASRVATLEVGDIQRRVVAPGLVEPERDPVALGFETSGRVAEVLVDEGDGIEAGALLARLDNRLARARVAAAEAALAAARARRDMALAGSRAAEVHAAESDLEAARAHARDRELARTRAERLASSGAIGQAEADGAVQASAAATAAAEAAGARRDLVTQGERSEQKRFAQANVAAAEADLEQARALLAQTELRAPARGVVLRRMIEVGEQVTTTPPKVALTLADLDCTHVRAEIDEGDVGRVRVGQAGWVTAEAYGQRRLAGRVVSLQRELGRKAVRLDDPHARADTRVLEVVFALDQPQALPLGLRMDVHLDTLERGQVLKAPLAAVRRATPRAETAEVTVVAAGHTSTRTVRIGADDGTYIEVVEGLAPGESVALP